MKSSLILFASLILAPSIHAATFKLDVENTAPLYQTTLIKEVYQYSGSNFLNDIEVVNNDGDSVPYARVPYEQVHAKVKMIEKSKPLVIFPMQEDLLNTNGITNIQLNRAEANTSISVSSESNQHRSKTYYLFDLGKKHPIYNKLSLAWDGEEGKLIPVEVMTSSDLKDWVFIGKATLLRVGASNETILQNSINLNQSVTSRYLKINPKELGVSFTLTSVNVEFNEIEDLPIKMFWQSIPLTERTLNNNEINIDFESPARYPASSLMINLPQQNTITKVKILIRNDINKPWLTIKQTSLYRLNKEGQELTNKPISIPTTTARYWRLSFSNDNGGIGTINPALKLGWLPDTLVWNARGSAPFILKVNESQLTANSVPIHTLLNPFGVKSLELLPHANLSVVSKNKADNIWNAPTDGKKIWLWAGLMIGVLALASMAYSLIKNTATKQRKER